MFGPTKSERFGFTFRSFPDAIYALLLLLELVATVAGTVLRSRLLGCSVHENPFSMGGAAAERVVSEYRLLPVEASENRNTSAFVLTISNS